MNKQFMKQAALVLGFALVVISCSKNTTDTTAPTNSFPVNASSTAGWTISSFSQRGENKTSSFSGYTFFFDNNGALTVKNGTNSSSGTWFYAPSSVGYYGSSPSKASFTINMGNTEPLGRLTRTWNIDSVNTTATNLVLLNPEVLENMSVIFSKQ